MQSESLACLDPKVSILSGRQSNLKFNHLFPPSENALVLLLWRKEQAQKSISKILGWRWGNGGPSMAASLGVSVLETITLMVSS